MSMPAYALYKCAWGGGLIFMDGQSTIENVPLETSHYTVVNFYLVLALDA